MRTLSPGRTIPELKIIFFTLAERFFIRPCLSPREKAHKTEKGRNYEKRNDWNEELLF